eukprot:gnl/Chilomastix_cuspidata/959.p1 GENE.gnl/Chilomastix_cuspidata/959~~gnl/Chilomastix_cuspidata/959.p1  ORF type:complete len:711 (-),score=189.15 gnl/Chilomastix_cuspidata/959:1956-3854(-)
MGNFLSKKHETVTEAFSQITELERSTTKLTTQIKNRRAVVGDVKEFLASISIEKSFLERVARTPPTAPSFPADLQRLQRSFVGLSRRDFAGRMAVKELTPLVKSTIKVVAAQILTHLHAHLAPLKSVTRAPDPCAALREHQALLASKDAHFVEFLAWCSADVFKTFSAAYTKGVSGVVTPIIARDATALLKAADPCPRFSITKGHYEGSVQPELIKEQARVLLAAREGEKPVEDVDAVWFSSMVFERESVLDGSVDAWAIDPETAATNPPSFCAVFGLEKAHRFRHRSKVMVALPLERGVAAVCSLLVRVLGPECASVAEIVQYDEAAARVFQALTMPTLSTLQDLFSKRLPFASFVSLLLSVAVFDLALRHTAQDNAEPLGALLATFRQMFWTQLLAVEKKVSQKAHAARSSRHSAVWVRVPVLVGSICSVGDRVGAEWCVDLSTRIVDVLERSRASAVAGGSKQTEEMAVVYENWERMKDAIRSRGPCSTAIRQRIETHQATLVAPVVARVLDREFKHVLAFNAKCTPQGDTPDPRLGAATASEIRDVYGQTVSELESKLDKIRTHAQNETKSALLADVFFNSAVQSAAHAYRDFFQLAREFKLQNSEFSLSAFLTPNAFAERLQPAARR